MDRAFNLPASVRKTAFIGTLVLILLLLTAGTAIAATTPEFSNATPAPGSIKANYDSYYWTEDGVDYYELINVSVIATDPDGISSTIPPGTNWKMPDGSYGSVWNTQATILNSTQALITATLAEYWGLPGGQQTMTMAAKDNLGNINTYTWSFIYDNNNPTASNLTPEVTENLRQTVSANITDTISGIKESSIAMTVDGGTVTPGKTAITNGYTVSYTPASDFSLGTHNVVLTFKDNAGRAGSKNFSFIVLEPNSAPFLLSFSPGENANQLISEDGYLDDFGYWVVTGTYFNFSAQVVDFNGIRSGSQSLILKNMKTAATTTVAPTLSYSNAEQTKASLSKKFSNYNEGVYQLNLTVQDNASPTSQTLNKVWNFNLYKDFPTASVITPADQSKTSNVKPSISARVTDATSGIDPASIAMKVDNQQIPTESISKVAVSKGYDVSYVPQDALLSGLHTVELTYTDNGGIAGSSTWSFTVQEPKPPEIVSITPNGSTAGPNVNIEAKFFADDEMDSTAGSYTMSIKYPDETTHTVTPSFTNSYFDPDNGEWVTMPKYGSITYTANLPEGSPYAVTVTAKAKNGLQASKTWSFGAYKDLPAVTNVTLAGKVHPNDSIPDLVLTETKPAMAARITDTTSGIDQSTISVKIDGVAVPQAAITAIPCANGFDVAYTPSEPLAVNQLHTVTFAAKDNKGFESSKRYQFFISQAPVASNVTPQDGSSLTDGEPVIAVHFADSFEELDTATITIDGKNVTPTVTYSSNKKDADVSWKGVLASGAHNIQVSMTSKHTLRSLPDETYYYTGGLTTMVNWSFTTTGYTDMALSAGGENEICLSCHGGAEYTPSGNPSGTWLNESGAVDFTAIHRIGFNYHGGHTCEKCHSSNTNFTANTGTSKRCNLCHVDPKINANIPMLVQNPVHSSFINYTFSDHNNASKYLINAPRTANDCSYCHAQPNSATLKLGATTGSNRHDVVNGHKVNFPDSTCQKCHNNILTREHAAAGRTDNNGNAMNCGSCHNNGTVKSKIPNYQPVRAGEEFAAPGKKITGARLTTYIHQNATYVVQAYYNGQWNDVWSKSITGANGWWNYGYEIGQRFPALTSTYTFDITWATPADKVRLSITGGGIYYYTKLDNWVFTTEDNITCSTCHPNADHAALHETGLVTDSASPLYWECSTCHKANLMNEHIDNPATKTKDANGNPRTFDCNTCHANADPEQAGKNEQVIAFGQKLCSDCHDIGHSQYMVSSVPSIIPVNPSFKWAAPMEAKLFASESWVPDEAVNNNAKVIISGRLNSVSGDSVWTWYRDNMQQQGWTVANGAPSTGSNYYTVTFTKGTKKAILWFYGGENHTAGPVLPAGYRVEMIYYDTAQ